LVRSALEKPLTPASDKAGKANWVLLKSASLITELPPKLLAAKTISSSLKSVFLKVTFAPLLSVHVVVPNLASFLF
jgi:hypothetical protein